MFTGIIRHQAVIKSVNQQGSGLRLVLALPSGLKLKLGDSVAVNGACLTVDRLAGKTAAEFVLMPETLNKTSFGKNFNSVLPKLVGKFANIELPLKYGQRLDGHFVLGHVDTTGKIIKILNKGKTKIFAISFPAKFKKLVVAKGSVAVDGVSLTIASVSKNIFSVSLVNYTLKKTTFGKKQVGGEVNLEFDILGKYATKYE